MCHDRKEISIKVDVRGRWFFFGGGEGKIGVGRDDKKSKGLRISMAMASTKRREIGVRTRIM